jgi:hypothetical protein
MRKRVTRVHDNVRRMVQDLHEKITAGNERVSGKSRGKVKAQNRFCRALARFFGKKIPPNRLRSMYDCGV